MRRRQRQRQRRRRKWANILQEWLGLFFNSFGTIAMHRLRFTSDFQTCCIHRVSSCMNNNNIILLFYCNVDLCSTTHSHLHTHTHSAHTHRNVNKL